MLSARRRVDELRPEADRGGHFGYANKQSMRAALESVFADGVPVRVADDELSYERGWADGERRSKARIAELEAEDDRLSNLCRDYKIRAEEAESQLAQRADSGAEVSESLKRIEGHLMAICNRVGA